MLSEVLVATISTLIGLFSKKIVDFFTHFSKTKSYFKLSVELNKSHYEAKKMMEYAQLRHENAISEKKKVEEDLAKLEKFVKQIQELKDKSILIENIDLENFKVELKVIKEKVDLGVL